MSGRVDKNLDLLCDSPFFEGVDPEHIEHFARLARTETFVAGDHIIVQGEPATLFYVLVEGKIELSFRKPGNEVPRNEEVGPEMLVLSRDLFEQYTKEHPDFGLGRVCKAEQAKADFS